MSSVVRSTVLRFRSCLSSTLACVVRNVAVVVVDEVVDESVPLNSMSTTSTGSMLDSIGMKLLVVGCPLSLLMTESLRRSVLSSWSARETREEPCGREALFHFQGMS